MQTAKLSVRSIQPDEIDLFASITDRPNSAENFANMIRSMWESGESKPEWCFIGEQNGEPVGRIGFMVHDGLPDAVAILGLTLPWETEHLEIGRALLQNSIAQLSGIRAIYRELNEAWGTFDQQAEVLKSADFDLLQTQHIYEIGNPPSDLETGELIFKPLEDVGKAAFVAAIGAGTAGTADRNVQALIAQDGMDAFAEETYRFHYDDHEVEAGWWQLAYTPSGELVGFTQPVRFPNTTEGNIAHIGVVPAQRGNGYSKFLLRHATNVLAQSGCDLIIARTDGDNRPMQRTFQRIGYDLVGQIHTYKHTITI